MKTGRAEGKVERIEMPRIGEKNQFATEMDHLRLSAGRQQPYIPGEEGLQDHRIMEAIYESARTGRPVKLQDASKLDAFRGPDA